MASSFAHQTDSNTPYSQHHTRPPPKFGYCCKGDNFNKFYKTVLKYLENLSNSCNPIPNYNICYTTHNISPPQAVTAGINYILTPEQIFNSHVIVQLDPNDADAPIKGPSPTDVLTYFNGNIPNDLFFILIITNATTGSSAIVNFTYTLPDNKTIDINPSTNGGETRIFNVLVKSSGDVYYFPYTS